MVANNFWGSFNNLIDDFKVVFFEALIFLTSFVLREKNATSEPENKPERKIKKATIINVKKRYVLLYDKAWLIKRNALLISNTNEYNMFYI